MLDVVEWAQHTLTPPAARLMILTVPFSHGDMMHQTGPRPLCRSVGRLAWLQIAPGVVGLLMFALLTMAAKPLDLPGFILFPIALLLGEVPASWWIMVREYRREARGRLTFRGLFPWATTCPWWVYLLGLPVIVLSLALTIVGMTVLPDLTRSWFEWFPEFLRVDFTPDQLTSQSRPIVFAMWVMSLVVFVGVGGLTQEMFSRGFLLPRMEHLGRSAPLFNAAFFSVLHLSAPWAWPAFFPMAFMWAVLVWWRRSIRIGVFVHSGMLFIQWVGMTLLVFGIQPPGQ